MELAEQAGLWESVNTHARHHQRMCPVRPQFRGQGRKDASYAVNDLAFNKLETGKAQ